MSGVEGRRDLLWLDVVDGVRAALAEASRRDVAGRVPPGLLARFVADGQWTLDDATELARRVSTPGARVEALVALASWAGDPVAARLWTESICVAATAELSSVDAWRLLAPRLPAALHPQALEAVAGIRDIGNRMMALDVLLPHLPVELMPAAFAAVAGVASTEDADVWLPEALCQIAGHLPLELVPDAFDRAAGVGRDGGRIDALLCLSAYLPAGWPRRLPPQRRRDLVAELAAARAGELLHDESQDLLGQELFTELLPAELLADAVAAAGAIDPEGAAFVLAGLSPRLPAELLAQARTVAGTLPDELHARALIGILPYLLDDAGLPDLAGVLTGVVSRADEEPPAWIRKSFLPPVPDPGPGGRAAAGPLTDTWAAVTALTDGWQRDYLIARLCPRLPDELLADAVARLADMLAADEYDAEVAARALVALAPRLDEPLLAQAWDAAVTIGDPAAQRTALIHLAPHLPASLISAALREASRLPLRSSPGGEHVRYAVLHGVASRVPKNLISKAVDALVPVWFDPIHARGREREAAGVLAGLVDRLAPRQRHDVLERALHTIASLDGRAARVQALARIAALLPEDLVPRALAIAVGVSDTDGGAEALFVTGDADRADLTDALSALASRAPTNLLLAVYAALTRIGDAEQLVAVRARLSGGEPVGGARADAETANAAAAVEPVGWDVVATATMLPIEWARARRQVEEALPLPAEPLSALVDRFAATQITEYPQEARAWALAGLAPHLASEVLPDALAMAAAIDDTYDRGGVLVGLAPYLPDRLRAEALGLARELPGDDRMWTLAGFALWLGDEERQRLVTEVRDGMTGSRRARTLARLAPWLPDDLIVDALTGTTSIEQPATGSRNVARDEHVDANIARDRADVVAAIVHATPPERRDRTFAAVFTRMAPYALCSIVDDLRPYLPMPLSPELSLAVMTLLDHRNDGASVRPLIERLPAALLPLALAIVDPSAPGAIAALLRRAHTLLAGSEPVRLAELIRQGLRIPQRTRADCLTVVEEAVRSLAVLGPPPAVDACAAVFDEVSARWP